MIIVRSVKANCNICSQNLTVDKFGILAGTVMGSCTVNAMVGYANNLANEKEKEYRRRYGQTELLFMRLCVLLAILELVWCLGIKMLKILVTSNE